MVTRIKENQALKVFVRTFMRTVVWLLFLVVCLLCTTGSVRKTTKLFVTAVAADCGVSISRSSSNVLQYLEHSEETNETATIQLFSHIYPVKRYVAINAHSNLLSYIEYAKEEMEGEQEIRGTKEDMDEFLYYNGKDTDEDEYKFVDDDLESEYDADIICGETYFEDESTNAKEVFSNKNSTFLSIEQLKDYEVLINKCFIVDPSTSAQEKLFDVEKFMAKDMTMEIKENKPQILILHTHSQETYSDSREGIADDTVVGVGSRLAEILEDDYGINVIHDTTTYDIVDGVLDRNLAYGVAGNSIKKQLNKNKDIEVVIDLHRDGVSEKVGKRLANINGDDCAQIMFFNGLSRHNTEPIKTLPNLNIENNLAFSFQLFYDAKNRYNNLCTKTYLKEYRFNMHLCPKYLLVELGTQYNTVEEAKNSMKYFAEILNDVLSGNNK